MRPCFLHPHEAPSMFVKNGKQSKHGDKASKKKEKSAIQERIFNIR